MPTFNRERAKTELGWSDQQIDAYLASPQAQQDSATASQAAPAAPSAGGGIDPLGAAAGMGASALEAIGGPRTLIGGGLLAGGAGYLLKRAMRGAKPQAAAPGAPPIAPPPGGPPAAPPVAPPPSSSAARGKLAVVEGGLPKGYTTVTARDLKEHPQALKAFKKGDPIQIKDLTKFRLQAGSGAPADVSRAGPRPGRRSRRCSWADWGSLGGRKRVPGMYHVVTSTAVAGLLSA